ncbi:hypothetical protein ACSSS7_007087 [Eimeria intestinalis]
MAAAAGEQSRRRSSERPDVLGRCGSSSSRYSSSCSRSCSRSTSSDDGSRTNCSSERGTRQRAAACVGSFPQRQYQEQQQSRRQGFWEGSASSGCKSLTGVSATAICRPTAAATTAAEAQDKALAPAGSARAAPTATGAAAPAAAAAALSESVVKLSALLQRMHQLQQRQLKLLRLRQQRLSLEKQLETQLTAAVAAHSSYTHSSYSNRRQKQAAAMAIPVSDCGSPTADRKIASSPVAAGAVVAGLNELLTAPCAHNKRSRSRCRSSSSSRSGSDISQDSRCCSPSGTSSDSSRGTDERMSPAHHQQSLHLGASGAAANRRRCSTSSSARRTTCKVVLRLRSLCSSMKKQLQQQGRCRDSLLLRFRSSKQRMAAAAAELQQQQQGVYCLRVLKLHEVVQLLPIENSESGRSILSLSLAPLPELIGTLKDSKARAQKALTVSAAAGFCVLLLLLISRCTDTPLQHRLLARGCRSAVCTLQGEELPLYLREGATTAELQQLQHGLLVLLQTVEGLACDRGHAAKPAAEGDLLQRIEALLHNEMWGFEASL